MKEDRYKAIEEDEKGMKNDLLFYNNFEKLRTVLIQRYGSPNEDEFGEVWERVVFGKIKKIYIVKEKIVHPHSA